MNIEFIKDNQKKINHHMSIYEDITRQLLDADIDGIFELTEKRKDIIDKISKLDYEIKKECSKNDVALSAYDNTCGRDELPDELKDIFDLRQEFNAYAFRVKELDPEITKRIVVFRDEIMHKIKKNNSGQNAKVAKYASAGMDSGGNLHFPENKNMI